MADPATRLLESEGTLPSMYTFTFSIDQVPYFKYMAQLFEYYKITRIQAVYKPRITNVTAAHSSVVDSTFVIPDMIYSYNPYSTSYTNLTALIERGDSYVVSPLEKWNFSFSPVPLVRGFDNLVNDAFLNMGPQWITTERSDTPHHGLVVGIETNAILPPTPSFGGRLFFYYSVSFKNPRLSTAVFGEENPPSVRLIKDGVEVKEGSA